RRRGEVDRCGDLGLDHLDRPPYPLAGSRSFEARLTAGTVWRRGPDLGAVICCQDRRPRQGWPPAAGPPTEPLRAPGTGFDMVDDPGLVGPVDLLIPHRMKLRVARACGHGCGSPGEPA